MQDLLEDGERVEREVSVGEDTLVVTDRRLLAFTPSGDGKNYRHVERPNVSHVRIARRSDRGHLTNGLLYLLIGVGTAVVGHQFLETDGLLGSVPTGPGAASLGIGDLITKVSFWLGLVDDGVVVLGAIIALPALYHAVQFLRSRQSVLSVGVAGDDDIDLPTKRVDDPNNAVEQLRLALDLPTGEAGESAPEWSTASD